MGKRSSFPRRKADAYLTWDVRPVLDLLPHLAPATRYREPCVGHGHLVAHLTDAGHICTYMADLPDDARLLPTGGRSRHYEPTVDSALAARNGVCGL